MSFDEEFEKIYENDTVLPERLAGEYTIVSCLKYTEERRVYIISDKAGKKYILKVGEGENADRLENEYRIVSYIRKTDDTDAFPDALSLFRENDCAYYIREFAEGITLRDRIEKHGTYSGKEACAAAYSICENIEKLHSLPERMICRDIKPENIVIAPDGKYLMIDLDAARTVKSDHENDTVCLGTRTTAAPEQFGFGQTDERTDVYAVGMLMLYMISGEYDKKALDRGRISRIIEHATRFDPERRYAGISKLKAALSPKRKTTAFAVAAAVCAAAVTAAIFFIPRDKEKEIQPVGGITAQSDHTVSTEAAENASVFVTMSSSAVTEITQDTTETQNTENAPGSSAYFVTDPVGDKISDLYLEMNTGWVLNSDGSYSYTCREDNERILFTLPVGEHFPLKDLKSTTVLVNTSGQTAWVLLHAPDTRGEWICSHPMGIADKKQRVILNSPYGVAENVFFTTEDLLTGSVITLSGIGYSDKLYDGPDIWIDNGDGSYTFTKDTVDALSLSVETDTDLSKVNYVYADIEIRGKMGCTVCGFNTDGGFTYCDGYEAENESKRLCWNVGSKNYNGRIAERPALDCYFLSDELTVTVKKIIFSEEPIDE